MFENIGGKLKKLAGIECWLGIIVSVIYSIILGMNSYYNLTAAAGLGILIGGCLLSYLGSMTTYAFGELVEDIHAMRSNNDSATMRPKYRQAVDYMKQKKYDQAARIFADIGEYEDSEELETECIYRKAIEQEKSAKYDEAVEAFNSIISYQDAEEKMKECYYQLGCAKLASDDFDAAYDAFEKADDYTDASNMLTEVRYLQAKSFVKAGNEQEAFELFSFMLGYKDVREIVEASPVMKRLLEEAKRNE